MISNILYAVEVILILLSMSLLYRVFKGPNIIDRVMAADSIDIILGVTMTIYGCRTGRAIFLDLGLIVTLLGFVSTVLICKYLEGKV
ncbi:monovalent cation/H+ antiporter complex subunit F [Clostridium sp.]|uniref:monovalent cation/H+ antiporter complex subunit F n=1 Tax=Clostridium sp. TaxID=1506 RepID=UPI002FCBF20A